ncbi:hypothetical protein A9Q99_18700 [Gammaproteobacteria bacterium 45_16_T64]|nr:hypothetical protein A9Q99_18700 [Gammaproteobacteria bacterium 45_16_T64]
MALITALVTGASSGIGYEISRVLAEQGHDLVLVARREQNLTHLANFLERENKIHVKVIAADLTDPTAANRIYQQLRRDNIPVDILVNNAGSGYWGPFTQQPQSNDLHMIQLNILALTQLTKLVSEDMVKRGLGKILNIASAASFVPGPYMSVYYASKAYVLSFSEALRSELSRTGVSVTTFCPGPVSSEFHQHAGTDDIFLMRRAPIMGSAQAAKLAVKAMQKRKAVEVPGILNKLLTTLPRFVPRSWVIAIARLILRPYN